MAAVNDLVHGTAVEDAVVERQLPGKYVVEHYPPHGGLVKAASAFKYTSTEISRFYSIKVKE